MPGLAAETAFFVMLAIFPGLLIAASLLGVLDVIGPDVADGAKRQVGEALDTVLTDEAAPAIASCRTSSSTAVTVFSPSPPSGAHGAVWGRELADLVGLGGAFTFPGTSCACRP